MSIKSRCGHPAKWRRRRRWLVVTLPLCLGLAAGASPVGAALASSMVGSCARATPREAYTARAFFGYVCRDDRCASHKAGFDWAERHGIADRRACVARNNPAFAEGCRAFAEEVVTAEQAGFEWARENELDDTCQCAGAGPRFEAGCQAYVLGLAD